MAKASKIVYSLAGYDVLYYTKICSARSKISTMGVFFEDLKPVRAKCCGGVKELIYIYGINHRSTLFSWYVGRVSKR